MTAQTILAARSLRSEFSTLATAEAYRNRSLNYGKWSIVLGDNGRFWVMSNRDASILVEAGYEYAV